MNNIVCLNASLVLYSLQVLHYVMTLGLFEGGYNIIVPTGVAITILVLFVYVIMWYHANLIAKAKNK